MKRRVWGRRVGVSRETSARCRLWPAIPPATAVGLWIVLAASGCSVALPAMAHRIGFRSAPGPESLQRLPAGREVTVGLHSGETVRGRYLGTADADTSRAGRALGLSPHRALGSQAGRALLLRRDGESVEIAFEDVRWIRTVPAWRTMLPAFALGLTLDVLVFREVLKAYGRGTDL